MKTGLATRIFAGPGVAAATIRAECLAAWALVLAGACVVVLSARRSVVKLGPVDCDWLLPSEKTWSWLATVPPLDEVGVPPTVIAMYSVPLTA